MNHALLGAVLVASFFGSLHCAGMCGPFVALYSGLETSPRARWTRHAAYHLGRLITYVALGAVAGALGSAVDLAGSAAGVARMSALVSGVLMVVWALGTMLETQGLRVLPRLVPTALRGALDRVLGRLRDRPPIERALVVGLSTTLLPCGWLYAFAVTAAGTGSIFRAMTVMGVFWLGSVPLLLAAGIGIGALSGRLRRHGPLLSSTLLLIAGAVTVSGRLHLTSFSERLATGNAPCPFHPHMSQKP